MTAVDFKLALNMVILITYKYCERKQKHSRIKNIKMTLQLWPQRYHIDRGFGWRFIECRLAGTEAEGWAGLEWVAVLTHGVRLQRRLSRHLRFRSHQR